VFISKLVGNGNFNQVYKGVTLSGEQSAIKVGVTRDEQKVLAEGRFGLPHLHFAFKVNAVKREVDHTGKEGRRLRGEMSSGVLAWIMCPHSGSTTFTWGV
jgi:hypothetical protein